MTYDNNNIFAKIIRGELPADKVYEDEAVLAFHDAYPVAPLHVLVIPKGKYTSFDDFSLSDAEVVKDFFLKVRHVAHLLGVNDSGYRLVTNHGEDAMQTVKHYHVYILAKKRAKNHQCQ